MSLRLSQKHGVNPSVEQCYYCGKGMGVLLLGKLRGDAEAPHMMVHPDKPPCQECADWMEKGVILISVDEEKTDDPENPWRTGGWSVVSDDFIRRVIQPEEMAEDVLLRRVAFVPDEAWDLLGLPRGEEDAAEE